MLLHKQPKATTMSHLKKNEKVQIPAQPARATLVRPAHLSLTASVTHATYIAGLSSSSTSAPRNTSESIPVAQPLANIRNTCFLNATIQLLRTICRRLRVSSFARSNCPFSQLLFANTGIRYNRVVDQHPLWNTLAKHQQHDPHELMLYF